MDAVLAKLEGFTSTVPADTEPSDLGTVANVLTGAAFAVNEKPYYVFYLTEGFTGTLTFSYLGKEPCEYEIINGYYHCKQYLVFEIQNVYEHTSEILNSAEGTVGEDTVSALGAYFMVNYIEGLTVDGTAPVYESALYAYAISAKNYQNKD